MKLIAVAFVVLALVACESDAGPPPEPRSTGIPAASSPTGKAQRFDHLTIELRLAKTTVASGGGIGSQIEVENRSERTVTDPSCLLNSPSFALVPADDPDAELWGAIVVDCGGPLTMRPGFITTFSGPTFKATDKFGDPLPPGDYYAGMELEGLSERLLVPIEITE